MSYGTRGPSDHLLLNGCLALVLILVPVVGHIILTVLILGDNLSASEKLLWLIVVWAVPFLGAFLYLLLGQRRNRLLGSRSFT